MKTHTLTTEQLQKLINAISDGKDWWPKHTNDPKVNYAVDCLTALSNGKEPGDYDEAEYLAEITKCRRQGLCD